MPTVYTMAHQSYTSFLFNVNELHVNQEPDNGGIPPRANENGRWVPPIYRAGFASQTSGRVFRWADGYITDAGGNYHWFDGDGWNYPNNEILHHYRSTSLFWCNEFTQFQMMEADATTIDIATSDFPNNRWYPLTFQHDGSLSRVSASLEEQYLAGREGAWIDQLGLQAYRHHRNRPTNGLAGNLATIVALLAFSCTDDHMLYSALVNYATWRRQWGNHDAQHGRLHERGVVANIYLDPENPNGSTDDTLYHLEWEDGPIIY
ncbi:26083eac-cb91-4279-aedc-91a5ad3fd6eb [Sclerotinia trifoliorum]|uniref:26083eac-cb91-4279-aedc-91a5ad3fd6eb n=1 Tax=Sclerotinia trifoliorum TaxID=28548 RepID=A0A8H2ZSV9_9HELO|nr:26083eac-cb91-4279-aedc-91a5ad3fd6eb [Sclerotinia trifoliorum]